MTKGYISRIEYRKEPKYGSMRTTDVFFTKYKEKAGFWETEQDADSGCMILDNYNISITNAEGQSHTCKGFQFEERAPGEYVIFCDAPFVSTEAPPQPGYKSDFQSLNPVAIKAGQSEVRAPDHADWGTVTCDQCKQKFRIGPNRIYGTYGNKTAQDYAESLEQILAWEHEQGRPHQNAYDLGF